LIFIFAILFFCLIFQHNLLLMPLKIIDHNSAEYKEMVKMRMQILRKPLGLSFSEEELDREKNDLLMGAFEEDELLGCCLLTQEGSGVVRLRQMAVQQGLQGKGVGRALMIYAENLARDRGFKKLTMHARDSAIGFYEKLGYKVVGEPFVEVNLPHHQMEKTL
jgi:GNAT superfamily N-acetyltransferase